MVVAEDLFIGDRDTVLVVLAGGAEVGAAAGWLDAAAAAGP